MCTGCAREGCLRARVPCDGRIEVADIFSGGLVCFPDGVVLIDDLCIMDHAEWDEYASKVPGSGSGTRISVEFRVQGWPQYWCRCRLPVLRRDLRYRAVQITARLTQASAQIQGPS